MSLSRVLYPNTKIRHAERAATSCAVDDVLGQDVFVRSGLSGGLRHGPPLVREGGRGGDSAAIIFFLKMSPRSTARHCISQSYDYLLGTII